MSEEDKYKSLMQHHAEMISRQDNQDKILSEIKTAVCGDPQMGHTGMVEDIRQLKKWRTGIDTLVNRGKGASILVGFMLVVAGVFWAAMEAVGTWIKK